MSDVPLSRAKPRKAPSRCPWRDLLVHGQAALKSLTVEALAADHLHAARKPHRQRKPSLGDALKQAAKVGLPVKTATVGSEGVTLQFGEGEPTAEASNPWLADLNKVTK